MNVGSGEVVETRLRDLSRPLQEFLSRQTLSAIVVGAAVLALNFAARDGWLPEFLDFIFFNDMAFTITLVGAYVLWLLAQLALVYYRDHILPATTVVGPCGTSLANIRSALASDAATANPLQSQSIKLVTYFFLLILFGGFGWIVYMVVTGAASSGAIHAAKLLVIPLGIVFVVIIKLMSKERAAEVQKFLQEDDARFSLYLRSFLDDEQVGRESIQLNRHIPAAIRLRWETIVSAPLQRLGPIVAIGSPRDALPPMIANLLYVGDADWQTVVANLIQRAQAIVMVAGETPWVAWELGKIAEQNCLAKSLVLIPPDSAADRAERWRNTVQGLPQHASYRGLSDLDLSDALAVGFIDDRPWVFRGSLNNPTHFSDAVSILAYVARSHKLVASAVPGGR